MKRMLRPYPALLALILLAPSLALAYSSAPPNGRTDAPGEGNCTACHSSFPLNSGAGSLAVTDLGGWEAGQTYDLTVTMADPDASRWGFELTILDDAGNSAGTLQSGGASTQTSTSGSRVYGKQTSSGTQTGTSGQASWTMSWTAPTGLEGDVTIYLAGNAANGNGSTQGDHIYTSAMAWPAAGASAVPLVAASGAVLESNFPNPFNPRTTIAFELERDQHARLAVYSLDGKLVRRLLDESRPAGRHQVVWDGKDMTGSAAASGIYLYQLNSGGVRQTRTMTLVR